MKRRAILVGGAACALMMAMPALAQQAGTWDGTWSGAPERGGSILITISGNRAASYVFRGQPVNVTGSQASGNSFTISVNGGIPGTVRLTKGKGQNAAYTYADTGGGSAKATLSRR